MKYFYRAGWEIEYGYFIDFDIVMRMSISRQSLIINNSLVLFFNLTYFHICLYPQDIFVWMYFFKMFIFVE